MTLPYENATSGGAALEEIRKVLTKFGCGRYGTMTDADAGELIVQFSFRGRDVTAKASYRGYAAAWLKEHPYGPRTRGTRQQHEAKAMKQAEISVCSVLRDWIKGQVVAIETGVLTFEGAFLGQILLPSGATVLEEVERSEVLLAAPDRGAIAESVHLPSREVCMAYAQGRMSNTPAPHTALCVKRRSGEVIDLKQTTPQTGGPHG